MTRHSTCIRPTDSLIELTESLAANEGLSVDMDRFKECKEQHKLTSGRGAFANSVMSAGPLDTLRKLAEHNSWDMTRRVRKRKLSESSPTDNWRNRSKRAKFKSPSF